MTVAAIPGGDASTPTEYDREERTRVVFGDEVTLLPEGIKTSSEGDGFGDVGIRSSHAYQLAAAGRLYAEFAAAGVSPLPVSEAQLRHLTMLGSFRAQRRAWERAVEDGDGDVVTLEDVLTVVRGVLGESAQRQRLARPRPRCPASPRAGHARPRQPPDDEPLRPRPARRLLGEVSGCVRDL